MENKRKDKKWFKVVKKIMRVRYKETKFVYQSEKIEEGSIIVCNHEGTDSPMAWEMYSGVPVSFWGAYQMNSGLRKMYSYQSKVYFHQKKGMNLFLARMLCLIASPLTNMFYKGLDVISTYEDARLKKTMHESFERLDEGRNLVIFPEKSDNGYQTRLEGFHSGVALLLELRERKGIDSTVYSAYYNKEKNICLVGAPKKYSEISEGCETREEVAAKLCDACNALGEETFTMQSHREEKREVETVG